MKASDWISVEDRLPRKNQRVIVCSLESIADYGGYYYYVLPELKIE